MASSDDFSGSTLGSNWQFEGPAGSAGVGQSGDEAYLTLNVPAGGDYDAWNGNTTMRAMQSQANTDFVLETRFLTEPSARYQMQGILVEQDDGTFVRFDVHHNGSRLKVFAAVTENNVSRSEAYVNAPSGGAEYMRVTRQGDVWTFQRSADGNNWVTVDQFTYAMNVTSIGTFAGSTGSNPPGFVAQVDYFELASDPIADEDGSLGGGGPVNTPPDAVDDNVATQEDTPVNITQATLLGNDTDADGNPLTITGFGPATNGTLTQNANGSVTFTPNPGFSGTGSFTYTVSDGQATDTATVNVAVSAAPPPPPPPPPPSGDGPSDDFSGASLDAMWQYVGPAGNAALGQAGDEYYVALTVPPGGDYDAWNGNTTGRLMQDAPDGNFSVETRFLSEPSARYQMQGIIVEEDANNFVRFDVHHNGSGLKIFAAITENGVSRSEFYGNISSGAAEYMRVSRNGDTWTFERSANGTNWTTVDTFNHALTANSIGPFAGSTGNNPPGFTSNVDYFEFSSDPIADEDGSGGGGGPTNTPPDAVNDNYATDENTDLNITEASLLSNDTDANGDALSIVSYGNPSNGTLTENANGTVTYSPTAGFSGSDSFTYTISDGQATDTAVVNVTVNPDNTGGGGNGPSDDFSGSSLDSMWSYVGPAGAANLGQSGSEYYVALTVPPGGDYDAWNGNTTGRLMQATADTDFTVETRFLSQPSQKYQMQGIIVEEDTNNFVRFDTHHDGNNLRIFAAVTENGVSRTEFYGTIPSGGAEYMRVIRNGDNWTFQRSADGNSWSTVDTFNHALTVNNVGPFVGSTGNNAPGFTSNVDYFEFASDPIADEDFGGGNSGLGKIDVWYGDVQEFGNDGESQWAANILGNVDHVNLNRLDYSLNGGAWTRLNVGEDTRRLHNDGDFNVELAWNQLNGSAADDTLTLRARYNDGSEEFKTVTIDYEAGSTWAKNYSVDWGSVSNLQNTVQVIDGLWDWDNAGIRPVEQGYDRLIAFGDDTWDYYQVVTSFTPYELNYTDPRGRDGNGFGFHNMWNGHTDNPIANFSPTAGWEPVNSFWFDNGRVEISSYEGSTRLDNTPFALTIGTTYNVIIRLEQSGDFDRTYKMKVWEQGTPEPSGWTVSATEQLDEPYTGSFLMNAHYHGITFGDVTITEIPGGDIIRGTEGNDTLIATNAGAANPGRGEIDVMIGEAGADVFVFGQNGKVFYDDDNSGSDGRSDYALVWDFDASVDTVFLAGSSSDYFLSSTPSGVENGTGIYYDNGVGELIGVLAGVTGLNLNSDVFDFENGSIA